jgi:hypothetical protein
MFSIGKSSNNAMVIQKIKNLDKLALRSIRQTMYENGKDLAKDARDLINLKPKHGLLYRIVKGAGSKKLKRKKDYRASAPGEAPGVITGKLRKSINFTVSGTTQLEFGVDTRSRYGGAEYGKYLEYANLLSFSGQGSKNIKPRPFISASWKKNKVKMMQRFDQAVRQVIK